MGGLSASEERAGCRRAAPVVRPPCSNTTLTLEAKVVTVGAQNCACGRADGIRHRAGTNAERLRFVMVSISARLATPSSRFTMVSRRGRQRRT